MSATNFTDLAHWLLLGATNADGITSENADLISTTVEQRLGSLDAALGSLGRGDLLATLERLDRAVLQASRPIAPPTSGRNQLKRHLAATDQRDALLKTAQIARILVLDGLKSAATSASTTPIEQTGA